MLDASDRPEFCTPPTRILLHHPRHIVGNVTAGVIPKAELERCAGITINFLSGSEIAKATDGVHCLTRPVYL